MSSRATDAADVIRKIVRQNEQLVLAAQILDEFGSFENAVQETKKALSGVRGETEEAKAELVKAKAAITKAKETAETILSKAAFEADAVVSGARESEVSIINAASVKADKVQSDALAATNAQQAALKSMTDNLAAKRDELQASCDALAIKERELVEQADAAESRLAKVRAQIAKLTAA